MTESTDNLNATVAAREDLTAELALMRIRPDSGRVPEFVPGQFCTVGLPAGAAPPALNAPPRKGPRLVRRAYSIGSSADERDSVELYLVLVRDGRLTPKLWDLHVGDRLYFEDKIRGEFTLEGVPSDKDLLLVSTGTGLAPYMSMLRTYRGRGERRWRRCVVIHGARVAADLGYRAELERTAAEDATLSYIATCTREPPDSPWAGQRGRVQAALADDTFERLARFPLDPARCHVLLCGNPDMIESVREMLEARGFVTQTREKPGNIHFERYW